MRVNTAGFTLLELIVVIAIIGILSTVVFGSLGDAKEKTKEVVLLKNIRTLNEAIFVYELDTLTKFECVVGQDCTQNLLVNPGVSGWKGPYYRTVTHPWGGPMTVVRRFSLNADPNDPNNRETLIYLNSGPNNLMQIPDNIMLNIDRQLDDGNWATGKVRYLPVGVQRVFVPGQYSTGEMLIKPEI